MKCTLQNPTPAPSTRCRSARASPSICSTVEAAGRRQRQAAHAVRAIRAAHRLAHDDLVAGEVGQRDVARIERMLRRPCRRCRARSRPCRTRRRRRRRSRAACARSRDCAASCRPAAPCRWRRRSRRAARGCVMYFSATSSACSRGDTAKPRSASAIAGSNSAAHCSRPCLRCAVSSRRTVPGTPTDLPPTTAS